MILQFSKAMYKRKNYYLSKTPLEWEVNFMQKFNIILAFKFYSLNVTFILKSKQTLLLKPFPDGVFKSLIHEIFQDLLNT